MLPLGFAAIVILGELTTFSDATAELTIPLVLVATVAGLILSKRPRRLELNRWCVFAAVGTFALYAAPIVLSGEATFAGYQRLDDTANWLAVSDHLLSSGRSLDGLEPSTYQQALALYVGNWYPVGGYPPLGIASRLIGYDAAWTIQPYMAYLGAMLALTLTVIARSVLVTWPRAAIAGLIAAQPALLVSYVLWGGVKEIVGALLLALVAVFAARALRKDARVRDLVPLAVAGAAMFFGLSFGSGAWLIALPFLGALLLLREKRSLGVLVRPLAIAIGIGAVLLLPFILSGKLGPGSLDSLTNPEDPLGNLVSPLAGWRLMGIWLNGDFRFPTDLPTLTAIAIGAAVLAGLGGLYLAWRRRAWPMLFFFASAAVGGSAVALIADAWIGGKALAMSSPGFVLAAMVGILALIGKGGRARAAGYAVGLLVVGGILASNFLAFHGTTLAPRDQLAELEQIGEEIAGQGPTLVTEYQPFAGRYFLRDGAPDVAADLRARFVPLANGGSLGKSEFADTDELDHAGIQQYRTLVLRRSPVESRPPAEYELTWSGEYYEVWQRPEEPAANVTHLPLGQTLSGGSPGSSTERTAVPDCDQVLDLAATAGPGGRLTAAPGQVPIPIFFEGAEYPASWAYPGGGNYVVPDSDGKLTQSFQINGGGDAEVWLGGSVRGKITASIDGEETGSVSHQINNLGQYIDLGPVSLTPGLHSIELDYSKSILRPGTGGTPYTLGPLLLGTSAGDAPPLVAVAAGDAKSLCGRPWDWIEAQG